MRTAKNIEPAEQEILKTFTAIINGDGLRYSTDKGDDSTYPKIIIESSVRIDKKHPFQTLRMELSVHLTDDPRTQLSRRLQVDCSCSIYVDGLDVVYASRISGNLATYIGGCLHDIEEELAKPIKEKRYKNFEKIIK